MAAVSDPSLIGAGWGQAATAAGSGPAAQALPQALLHHLVRKVGRLGE